MRKSSFFPRSFGILAYQPKNKANFLLGGRNLLEAVGKALMVRGAVSRYRVSVNQAGIAVGGDIYGEYVSEDGRYAVLVTLTHSVVNVAREDGVVCYLQERSPRVFRGKVIFSDMSGVNHYVDDINEDNIMIAVMRVMQRHPRANCLAVA